MLNRNLFFISLFVAAWPLCGYGQDSGSVKIIEPKKKVVQAKSAQIDTEKFQAGFYFGTLSVEDFSTNAVMGLSFSYQITEDYLAILNYGSSDVAKSTYEKREDLIFLTDSQRELSYIDLLAGYKLFTARSFLGTNHKYDSDIYLLAGLGSVDYAGESNVGFTVGASYRVVFTDWLVVTFDFKDHFVDRKNVYVPDESKLTQNLELTLGVNALF